MKVYNDYSDKRLRSNCVYCDNEANTREHIPSKVFLSKPYPSNLHVVSACQECNNGFSKDEEFVAFILDYLNAIGSEATMDSLRAKYHRWDILEKRILKAITRDNDGSLSLKLETERILNIIKKFAICHVLYETGIKTYINPSHMVFGFFSEMSEQEIIAFNTPIADTIFPEIGSRLMQRMALLGNGYVSDWVIVQEGNYRYYVTAGSIFIVRLVIKETLFCEITWDEL